MVREHPAVASYWDAVQKCFDTRFGWSASLAGVQTLVSATRESGERCLTRRL